jgi:NADPH2:quinone reductase
MKTIVINQYGGPEVLELTTIEKPVPKADEVLVKANAIGINYANIHIRQGKYAAQFPLPANIPGEIEGIIEAVGSNVKHLIIGQRVTGMANSGFAEYAVIDAKDIFVLPVDLPFGHGLLTQGLTAQYLLAKASPFDTIIITAAAGGVGSFVVQLARLKGAKNIIALSGNKDKAAYLTSLGATQVISYFDTDWQAQLLQATGGNGAEVVLDAIGGSIGTALIAHLSFNGTMVVYGNMSDKPLEIDANMIGFKSNRIMGATIYHATNEEKQQWFNELTSWIQAGTLKFNITTYPFATAAAAFQAIEDRNTIGKVILTI